MSKLKIGSLEDEKPVKVTIELPAAVDRDLRAYAEVIKRESGYPINDSTKLIVAMLKRFMATDRAFKKSQRQSSRGKMG
jgi:hypothetical protein